MTPYRRLPLLLSLALLTAACSAGATGAAAPSSDPAANAPTASAGVITSATPDISGASPIPSAEASPAASPATPVLTQPWATAELTDVATGEAFRLADLAGKVVILETMAIWCTTCLAQQGHVYEALGELDPERVAYVLIDVDPSETQAALATYRERNGFTGTYAVATSEVARALTAEFGDQMLNPPATPMILIGTDGRVTLTPFEKKSAAEIVSLAEDHGA